MENQNTLAPILGEKTLLIVACAFFILVLMGGICFTLVLKKAPTSVHIFRGTRFLEMLTVIIVVFTTFILGLERILTGEAVAGIFGGVVGYVLGSLKRGPETIQSDRNDS